MVQCVYQNSLIWQSRSRGGPSKDLHRTRYYSCLVSINYKKIIISKITKAHSQLYQNMSFEEKNIVEAISLLEEILFTKYQATQPLPQNDVRTIPPGVK